MQKQKSKSTGFTLAEVLITLGIIGVVAAITIPTLINNIQDAQYKTAFKKIYSELSAATKLVMNDNGGDLTPLGMKLMVEQLPQYMRVKAICENNIDDCWHWPHASTAPSPSPVKMMNHQDWGFFYHGYGMLLENGAYIVLNNWWPNACNGGSGSESRFDNCNDMNFIDVNGSKPPNTVDRDIFSFYFVKYGIRTMSPSGYSWHNQCPLTTGNSAGMCSTYVLMGKDY